MVTVSNNFHEIMVPVKERLPMLASLAGVTVESLKENLQSFLIEMRRIRANLTLEQGVIQQGWIVRAGVRNNSEFLKKLVVNDYGLLFLSNLIRSRMKVFFKLEKFY